MQIIRAADEAEARGDAWEALRILEDHPAPFGQTAFWRRSRVVWLMQVAALGSVLPGWAFSRWVLEQAAHWLDPAMRSGVQRALRAATMAGGHRLPTDDIDARTKILDHDWIFRQLLLYDEGGLARFLQKAAAPDLLARADRVWQWARTPMGGFLLESETPKGLTWRHLASGVEVTCLNLGAATLVAPGASVIGRVVPIEQGAMFETVPLPVPENVAVTVAKDPASWLPTLAQACSRDSAEDETIRTLMRFQLLTDVPPAVQDLVTLAATEDEELPGVTELEDLLRRRVAVVRLACAGESAFPTLPCSPWPTVAAVLVDPLLLPELPRRLRPDEAPALLSLAQRLPDPASRVCVELAQQLLAAA